LRLAVDDHHQWIADTSANASERRVVFTAHYSVAARMRMPVPEVVQVTAAQLKGLMDLGNVPLMIR
jgi:hypothetical protein